MPELPEVETTLRGIEPAIALQVISGNICLLYTSDAADDLLCADLGGRRIIKKKKNIYFQSILSPSP